MHRGRCEGIEDRAQPIGDCTHCEESEKGLEELSNELW